MTDLRAFAGARLFDGFEWHDDAALIVAGDRVQAIVKRGAVPVAAELVELPGGLIIPGLIDLQVNGGGGVLLNDRPDLEGVQTICAAHTRLGTTTLLPTLITDTPEVTERAIAAGIAATEAGVAGFLGLHIEGPHLAIARKGAHLPDLIRPMTDADLDRLVRGRAGLPALLTTVAPETVDPRRIAALGGAGIVVSLGHSDADYRTAVAAADAGARMVTHLFNAMSPLGHRQPGVVGAALETGPLFAGLIADGLHVDPAVIAIALRAKRGPGHIFLVSDSMSLIGTDMQSFELNGRTIRRANGGLRLADGTLAGADITLLDAVRFVHRTVGLPLAEAVRMASLYPARAMRLDGELGHLGTNARASFVHLAEDLGLAGVWIDGQQITGAFTDA